MDRGARRVATISAAAALAVATVGIGAPAAAQCLTDLTQDGRADPDDYRRFQECRTSSTPDCDMVELDVTRDGVVDACDSMAIRCSYETLLGEECCTRPCDPRCNGDLNSDGVTNVSDLGSLSICIDEPLTPQCEPEDLDGDGDVDCHDFGAWACLFDVMTATSDCCVDPPCRCNCVPYVTDDTEVNQADLDRVQECIGADDAGDCERADVDCDGDITACDADIVSETIAAGEFDTTLCERTTCGACVTEDGCSYRSGAGCRDEGGTFSEDSPCDGAPPPPSAEHLPRFRGGGGVSCASVGGDAPDAAAVFFGLVLGLLIAQRRRDRG